MFVIHMNKVIIYPLIVIFSDYHFLYLSENTSYSATHNLLLAAPENSL